MKTKGGAGKSTLPEIRASDDDNALALEHAILDRLPTSCVLLAPDWTIAHMNTEAEQFFQRPVTEVVGKNVWVAFPEALNGYIYDTCRLAMDERRTAEADGYCAAYGSWVAIQACPWASGIAIFLRDTAREHRTAERVLETESQLRDFLESATDLIHMLTPDGRVLYANRAWREKLGYSEEETTKLSLRDVLAPESFAAAREHLDRCLKGDAPREVEMTVLTKEGRRIVVRGSANCRFVNGDAVSTRGIYRDVTAEIESAELLRRAQRTEASAIRAKTAFLDRVSHELRTPLAAVIGFADILRRNRDGNLSPREITFSERIATQGRNLLTLIEDVLAYAEIEARTLEFEATSIDVAALLRSVVDQRAAEAPSVIPVVLHARESVTLDTDVPTLRRIVRYLLDDAIKRGTAGTVTVRLVTDAAGGLARAIEVRDDLWRDGNTTAEAPTDPSVALELGLTVARSLCHLLGYRFVMETDDSGATTRRVELYDAPQRDRRAQDELATALHVFLAASPLPIMVFAPDWTVRIWNNAAARVFGWTSADVVGKRLPVLRGADEGTFRELLRQSLESPAGISDTSATHVRRDGTPLDVNVSIAPLRTRGGRLRGFISIVADVSERKRLESELRQAQKMEVVGRLAGGIAHDFNNLLTVIGAHTEFLIADTPDSDERREDAEAIRDVTRRGADLTRQLLLYARKEVPERQVFDLNLKLADAERMLRRTLGSHIEFITVSSAASVFVDADPSQIEHVILNLALNARDAMPEGGALVLETSIVMDDADKPAQAQLTVSDTGIGMDADTRAHVFEPFFTTKEPGKGTGLGLATVHTIVEDAGGSISVDSERGKGTTFRLRLPLAGNANATGEHRVESPDDLRGDETVLVVEDQDAVREVTARVLRAYGYRALLARHGHEALRVVHGAKVDLVVSDLMMPEMDGHQLAAALRAEAPDVAVIFMSGYSETVDEGASAASHPIPLVRKPFTGVELATAVRHALDARRR